MQGNRVTCFLLGRQVRAELGSHAPLLSPGGGRQGGGVMVGAKGRWSAVSG